MAGFDNLRQEAMRRVKEMQQNASSQENNSKRQNRNDNRGSFPPPQTDAHHTSHNEAQTFSGGQNGNKNQQSQNHETENIDLQRLAESFSGDDIKAAKTGGEVLDACFHDKEKSLILILILLLSSDNADTGLLLALMYLLI